MDRNGNIITHGGNTMKSKLWLVTIVMIAALALSACSAPALSGTLSAAPTLNQAPATSAPALNQAPSGATSATGQSTAALGNVSDLQQTVEQIFQQVNPSVVAIQVVEQASGSSTNPFFNNP
jgi:S1-C subfamily serine protease